MCLCSVLLSEDVTRYGEVKCVRCLVCIRTCVCVCVCGWVGVRVGVGVAVCTCGCVRVGVRECTYIHTYPYVLHVCMYMCQYNLIPLIPDIGQPYNNLE